MLKHLYLKKIFLLFLLFSIVFQSKTHCQTYEIYSPDKNIKLIFSTKNSTLYYKVLFKNKEVIKPSELGFTIKGIEKLNNNFIISNVETDSINEIWKPIYGQFNKIVNKATVLKVNLKSIDNQEISFEIIFRAYNEGIAFRYTFPKQDNLNYFEITDELTRFNFAEKFFCWSIPNDGSYYEQIFTKKLLSEIKNVNTPLTIEGDDIFMVIHEASLVNYSSMSLISEKKENISLKCDLAPWSDGVKVKATTPFITPWRYILISDNIKNIMESSMVYNLNDPNKEDDISFIKPLKFVGIFWGMHTRNQTWFYGSKHGATTENAKKYIDFASKNHIEGILIEGWNKGWETWQYADTSVQNYTQPYPDFDIREVVKYARSKGIEIIGHHETGGNIPMYEKQMDSAFKYYNSMGIHYVKTGYAGEIIPKGVHRHGQQMVRHYQQVADLAYKYKINIDSHEPIMPSGLSRTYPNWMNWEAVRGIEWCNLNPYPPSHVATLPFTRSLAGPFDFTPGIFKQIYDTIRPHMRVYSTLANQLALYVVFYSPMQMAADIIENYKNNRAFKFIANVPCSWDSTVFVNGKIGDYITFARKKNNEWYIGSVTNEKERINKIALDFLDKGKTYKAEIYCDSISTNWVEKPSSIEIKSFAVTKNDTIYSGLAKCGGIAIRLIPTGEKNSDRGNLLNFNKETLIKNKVFNSAMDFGINKKHKNLAEGKEIFYKIYCDNKYEASGKTALIDGHRGTTSFIDGYWQGWQGNDMEIVIDLGKITEIHKISSSFLQSSDIWIFQPKEVHYYISNDSLNFTEVAKFNYQLINEDLRAFIKEYTIDFDIKKARFIKVVAENIRNNPEWHYAKGGSSWLFCDEIIIE